MLFEVYLSPTTASPPEPQIRADVRAAVTAENGRFDRNGAVLVTSDGLRVKLGGDDEHFLLDHLSPSFCRILFNAARQSNSTVNRGGSDLAPLQMKGSSGATRYVRMRMDPIANPVALCGRLARDLRDWNRFVNDAQRSGELGPDGQLLEPPPSPGAEPRVATDASGVAAHCEALRQFGWKIERKVVSRNPQYGVVWRADVTLFAFGGSPSRVICWKRPGRNDYSIIDRPLEMFDATQSVPPLTR